MSKIIQHTKQSLPCDTFRTDLLLKQVQVEHLLCRPRGGSQLWQDQGEGARIFWRNSSVRLSRRGRLGLRNLAPLAMECRFKPPNTDLWKKACSLQLLCTKCGCSFTTGSQCTCKTIFYAWKRTTALGFPSSAKSSFTIFIQRRKCQVQPLHHVPLVLRIL